MAFTDEQKINHIAELQRYLFSIEYLDGKQPDFTPDGIYGIQTENAVREFQKENGLPETGEANTETWDRIVEVYQEYMNCYPLPCSPFPSKKYICGSGTEGLLVYMIQAMMLDLGKSYDNVPKINVCGHFNEQTSEAVRFFQKKCGIPCNGAVDCMTWNMLVKVSSHKIR